MEARLCQNNKTQPINVFSWMYYSKTALNGDGSYMLCMILIWSAQAAWAARDKRFQKKIDAL